MESKTLSLPNVTLVGQSEFSSLKSTLLLLEGTTDTILEIYTELEGCFEQWLIFRGNHLPECAQNISLTNNVLSIVNTA